MPFRNYTIADFNPVAAYEAEGSRLFTDTAGTTLANYGQQVARWNDPFNAHNATQATAGSRPFRATAPITGVRNLANHSDDFANSVWNAGTNPTIATDVEIAPDGTLTADRLTVAGGTAARRDQTFTIKTNTPYTWSVWVKKGSPYGGQINIHFVNAVGGGLINQTLITPTDTWTKISFNGIGSSHSVTSLLVRFYVSTGAGAAVGDVLFAWRAQLEEGTVPTFSQRRVTQYEVYEQGVPNRDYLFFDGSDDFFIADSIAPILTGDDKPYTIVYVVSNVSTTLNSRSLYSLGSSSSINPVDYPYINTSTNRIEHFRRGDSGGGKTLNMGTPLTTAPMIYSISFAGQTATLSKNGTIITQSGDYDATALTANQFTIGAFRRTTVADYMSGNYHALYIFNKALTPADRIRFQALVSQKWQVANLDYPQGIAGVPGVQLWTDFTDPSTLYDATSGGSLVAPDGAIARAEDKSGNNFHATQATSGNRPVRKVNVLNGRDVARFTRANSHWLNLGKQLGKPANFTIILIAKINSSIPSPGYSFFAQSDIPGTGNTYWGTGTLFPADNGKVSSYHTTNSPNASTRTLSDSTVFTVGEWVIFASRYKSGETLQQPFINGVRDGASTPSVTPATSNSGAVFDTAIGKFGEFVGGNYFINADMAGVIVADKYLPPMDLNAIFESLGEETGLEAPFVPERKNTIISYPDIPSASANIETNQSWNTLKRHWNLFRGHRYQYAELASSSSSDRIFTFTLPDRKSAVAGDEYRSVDHFAIARADLLLASGDTNLELQFSNDKTLWQTAWVDTITSEKLTGIRKQDYITNVYNFGKRKYWRFIIKGGTGISRFSKLYLGSAWDAGVQPSDFIFNLARDEKRAFESDSGARFMLKTITPTRTFVLKYEGVSDALTEIFIKEITTKQANREGVFIWNPTQKQILDYNELVHCKISKWMREEPVGFPNWNNITIELEEMQG
jgi:hypothetical protein